MKTIGEILKLTQKHLEEHGISNARRSAEDLLCHHLKKTRLDLYMNFEMPIEEKELIGIRQSLKRRAKGEPLEYILGEVKFFNLDITITPAVIIPRQETEIFLSKIVDKIKKTDVQGKVVWDVCCGSGCLGLGLKKSFADLEVVLSDISEEALNVAKINGQKNGLEVQFLQGDLLEPFVGKKADFIVCNPPYIGQKEYDALDPEVRSFEPKGALLAGPEGTEFYERFQSDLPRFLNPEGQVFFEIGYNQGTQIKNIFSAPCWRNVVVEKDWSGHDRFVFLQYFS
jgi:release factor glutamine methyltransferase